MEKERWKKIEQIYSAALEHKLDQRQPYLDGACGGDAELRRERTAGVRWRRQRGLPAGHDGLQRLESAQNRQRLLDGVDAAAGAIAVAGMDRFTA